jgi:polyhydroxybutyrate depolymerase
MCPPQAASRRLPVVLSLHDGGGNAAQHRRSAGMDATADRDGYFAVYPNGSGRFTGKWLVWNAGICCGYAQAHGVDDVGFLAGVIDDIERRAATDPKRAYVVGHANGGMMAHRFGEAMPGRMAAVASVAGAHVPETARGRAIPLPCTSSQCRRPPGPFCRRPGPAFPLTASSRAASGGGGCACHMD